MNITRIEDSIRENYGSEWTLGASTLPFPHDPVKGVRELLNADIRLNRIEIALAEPLKNEENTIGKLKKLKDNQNLEYSVHVPFLYDDLAHPHKPTRQAYINEGRKAIDLAAKIGAGAVVLHPGYLFIRQTLPAIPALEPLQYRRETYRENSLESLRTLSAYSPGEVKLLVENLPSGLCDEPEEIEDLLSGLTNTEFLLDIGHANVSGTLDELIGLHPRFFHFHDNGGEDDSHGTLGEGTINLARLLRKLKGYDASKTIIFELYSIEDLLESLRNFKSSLEI